MFYIIFRHKGGRYSLSSIGELHIHKADPINDGQHQYRCQTKHRLSGEVKLSSNAGRLVVTGKFEINCLLFIKLFN